jgi:hypothetical protein
MSKELCAPKLTLNIGFSILFFIAKVAHPQQLYVVTGTEKEFFDTNLIKTRVFCSMIFTVSSTGGFYRKLLHTKNPRNKKT